jgi:hypothetical protein
LAQFLLIGGNFRQSTYHSPHIFLAYRVVAIGWPQLEEGVKVNPPAHGGL